MKELFVIIDMQNDFVTGSLKNASAEKIIPKIIARMADAKRRGAEIAVTRDVHTKEYLTTQEGRMLPIEHCIAGEWGSELVPEIKTAIDAVGGVRVFDKGTFGSVELAEYVKENGFECVTLTGVCTDICVIANAILIKSFAPETEIRVTADSTAGVTEQSHENALSAMSACQIKIL